MIINIPDVLVGIIFGLLGICVLFQLLSIILQAVITNKISEDGEYRNKKWIYTRRRIGDNE